MTRSIKVALIRGSALNPYDLQQYAPGDGVAITGFASRQPSPDAGLVRFPVVRLWSHGDLVPRRVARGLRALRVPEQEGEHLYGLERATRGFDILHAAESHLAFSAQAATIRRSRADVRLVLTVWENIPFLYEDGAGLSARKQLVRSTADRFVAVTETARDALLAEGVAPERIEVRSAAVDTDVFSPAHADATRFAGLGPPQGARVVLFVGRLIPEKGLIDLVRAIAALPDDVHLVAIGRGAEAGHLMSAASLLGVASRVHIRSALPYERVPALMASCDALAVPSVPTPYWLEQFGMVLAEGMASGAPVVACDSGAIGEVVGDGGLLTPPYDSAALATALHRVLDEDRLSRDLRERARRRAVERFDAEAARVAWRAFYQGVVSDG